MAPFFESRNPLRTVFSWRRRSRVLTNRFSEAGFLYAVLAEVLATRTTAEWLEFCEARGIPATRLATIEELVDELPEAEHPVAGTYKVLPPPARFERTPATLRRPAPRTGEHTREVLLECGLTPEEVERLVASGVAHEPGWR